VNVLPFVVSLVPDTSFFRLMSVSLALPETNDGFTFKESLTAGIFSRAKTSLATERLLKTGFYLNY